MKDNQQNFSWKTILCFADRASRYICVIKTNLMHCLSSVHFVNQPLHVSGIFVDHYQEVYCIYTAVGTCCGRIEMELPSQPGQQTSTEITQQISRKLLRMEVLTSETC